MLSFTLGVQANNSTSSAQKPIWLGNLATQKNPEHVFDLSEKNLAFVELGLPEGPTGAVQEVGDPQGE